MNPIVTRVAHADFGDNRFRGYVVNEELAGRTSWPSMFSLAIGGPLLNDDDAALVTDLAVCILAADPRIWPLKIVRLVASYGDVLPALAAGHLAIEGAIIGTEPTAKAAEMLVGWGARLGADPSPAEVEAFVDELLSKGRAPGFGVAFRPRDERVDGIKQCLRMRGREGGRYWRLVAAIDRLMTEKRGVQLNLALASSAVLLDVGFTPAQVRMWMSAYIDVNYYANAVEEASLQSQVLRRLPDASIEYVGRAARTSPRAEAKRTLDSQAPELADPAFR